MPHKPQNDCFFIFHLSFFIRLSVEHAIVAFVMDRGNTVVVLGDEWKCREGLERSWLVDEEEKNYFLENL
jgi:hypothetical protein